MTVEKPISRTTLYVDGAARFHDLIYIVARDRALNEEGVEHSRFIGFDRMEFGHNGDKNWSALAVCVARKPTEKMVSVGEDGEVMTYVGGAAAEERILPEPMAIRNLGVIQGLPYACGMDRQVFRRDGENTWTAMHAPNAVDAAGFEAIDGYTAREIYAVGWNGEIWEWDGTNWSEFGGLTNLILTGVCCAGNDEVYVCGQNGTLISGRHGEWRLIELDDFETDFWDVHWFNGKLYLATMQSLYTYDDDGLALVNFGDNPPATCYRLSSAEGTLWSVGNDDVLSFDGEQWTRVD